MRRSKSFALTLGDISIDSPFGKLMLSGIKDLDTAYISFSSENPI
jgi:hypothetical protein